MTESTNSPTWKRRLRAVVPAVVLVFVAAAAVYAYMRRTQFESLEVYGKLPAFELVDQKNRKVANQDLAGKVVIANFIFTRCPTICPTFSMKMQRVAKRLADEDGITFVSFSVDPEYDSPEVLAEFAAKFKADPERWRFLTGDPETIKRTVTDGLAIAIEKRGELASGAPDIVHGTHFVLIDGDGLLRGYYNSDTRERIDELVRDARGLAD
ncbi:MAG: SCO family protein [Deltaproteobacteria bacterium]|nr:SCO family protein [Deltaproteobacteria bacterium]